MNNPKISLVVAISKNKAIGKDNKLLWYIPDDLKRFKAITKGHPVIMGRKTFESIGRPLPDRVNIVVTRDAAYSPEGVTVAHSLEEAIHSAKSILVSLAAARDTSIGKEIDRETDADEIFIIGGGQIFEQAMPLADKLYITVIDADVPDADAYFPDYPHFNKVLLEEEHEHDGLRFTFYELEKEG